MPVIVGYDESLKKNITCSECCAIIRYSRNEVQTTNRTDEGEKILGFNCPGCGNFIRTNP